MIIANLRALSEQHKRVALVLALIPLAIALVFFLSQRQSTDAPEWPKAYFFDEASGEVSIRPANHFPPLVNSSGTPTVVRAIYVTHSTPEHKTLAYLEKYTDDAKARLERETGQAAGIALARPQLLNGLLVRSPEPGSPWLAAGSEEAEKLLQAVFKPGPSGVAPRMCPP